MKNAISQYIIPKVQRTSKAAYTKTKFLKKKTMPKIKKFSNDLIVLSCILN